MRISKITGKTITIDGEPGDRIGLDEDGYCIDRITVRADAATIETARAVMRGLNTDCREDDERHIYWAERKARLLDNLIDDAPRHRVWRVWVGHNY